MNFHWQKAIVTYLGKPSMAILQRKLWTCDEIAQTPFLFRWKEKEKEWELVPWKKPLGNFWTLFPFAKTWRLLQQGTYEGATCSPVILSLFYIYFIYLLYFAALRVNSSWIAYFWKDFGDVGRRRTPVCFPQPFFFLCCWWVFLWQVLKAEVI